MSKKKVLSVGEASFLSTGFGTYGREVLSRLYSSNQFELFELGCYAADNDQRRLALPWKFYGNMPMGQEEQNIYNSNPTFQFGEWRFEKVLLDCKPDVVINWTDPWMQSYINKTSLRRFFKYIHMPTVDAIPLRQEWIADYLQCDGVFAYTDWGLNVLKEQSGGRIKTISSASPGANLKAFFPVPSKKQHKSGYGLPEDSFIVGTVMRNQMRKLYPDLIAAFKNFLGSATKSLREKSYLYLHCAYPDVGWDIPLLINESGIGSRVLLTYVCPRCHKIWCSVYSDSANTCGACGHFPCHMPNSQFGIPPEFLGSIINLFDVYIQWATCEGFGMPMVEAAACGVPVVAVDYSAMSDVVRKLEGFPVEPKAFVREASTLRLLAVPDNIALVNKLIELGSLTAAKRQRFGFKARMGVENNYSWDKTAQKWADAILATTSSNPWNEPPSFHQPKINIPNNLTNEQFVIHCLVEIAGRPDLINTYACMRLIRDLNWGGTNGVQGNIVFNEQSMLGAPERIQPFNRQNVIDLCKSVSHNRNQLEQLRTGVNNVR